MILPRIWNLLLSGLPLQPPWIRPHSLEISRSRENLQRYVDMAARWGRDKAG